MAIPLSVGSVPEIVTLETSGVWSKAFSSVNTCKVKNTDPSNQKIYMTYVNVDGDAPTDLVSQPVWSVYIPAIEFSDSVTARDVYLWTEDEDSIVHLEA